MARDRQRAKARKARRAAQDSANPITGVPAQDSGNPITGGPAQNLPGTDHVSGEVDQFETRLVGESGGEPVGEAAEEQLEQIRGAEDPEGLSDAEFAVLEDRVDDVEEAFETGDDAEIERAELAAVATPGAAPGAPTKKGRGRTIAFLRASWAELQRVQWPDRRQVGQATAVVLGFVVVAGLYLGLADVVAQKIVDIII